MAYNFKNDKNAFFAKVDFNAAEPFSLDFVEERIRRARLLSDETSVSLYSFLLQANRELEAEFNSLITEFEKVIKARDSDRHSAEKRKAVWFYYYYCCRLLMEFYGSDKPEERAYHDPVKRAHYEKHAAKIKQYLEQNSDLSQNLSTDSSAKSSLSAFLAELRADFVELLRTPLKVSSIRSKLGFLNLWRVFWAFCRLTFTTALNYFRDSSIIDKFEQLLGSNFDEKEFIRKMEAPSFIFNALSVGLFVARLLLTVAIGLRHTFFPQGAEKDEKSAWERFKFEFYKRHPVMMNDVAWATVNLLTNYPELINISAPVANWLVAGFLVFDLLLILWQRHLDEKEFKHKNEQYRLEIDDYLKNQGKCTKQIQDKTSQKESFDKNWSRLNHDVNSYKDQEKEYKEYQDDIARLEKQKQLNDELLAVTIKAQQELRISWETKNSTHCFNALAAALFVAGFSATFLFAAPVVAVVGYAACMVAVAMYLSSGAYGDYKEKSLRFYDAEGNYDNARGGLTRPGLELIQAKNNSLQALQAARKEFWLTMARNVVIPTLMLALLAACWQAAVVFAVL